MAPGRVTGRGQQLLWKGHACMVAGARLVQREVVRDGRTVWVEGRRVTVSSAGDSLELQRDLGVPVLLEGDRLTVMAEGV